MSNKKKNMKTVHSIRSDREKACISPEEREKMIRVAAFYRAEKNHFQGDARKFWIEAEKEIDSQIT
ncbi:MAG: DUF2934 domain-containing protein [Planctomycetota bacterium]